MGKDERCFMSVVVQFARVRSRHRKQKRYVMSSSQQKKTHQRKSPMNPFDAVELAKLSNSEIANFYAELMVKDIINVNEKGPPEFGDYDRAGNRDLFNEFVEIIEEYLNEDCPGPQQL
jgi:hypothetical protein